ncbi:MAG: hypothetical protein ACI8PW_001336 [Methylophilaceae bacterium]|jgi:hypothetical protein
MLNFLGIGVQKIGTSWLYKALVEHPKIQFPAGKEVHFWDQNYGRGVDWYLQHFTNEASINGDITPAYGILPIEVIQEIYDLMPHLRLFYLIRNPIERAWSSARIALARAEMLHEEASDQWFVDHFNSHGSLARGDYETCIRQWLSVFPSNQLLIIKYEEISHNPTELLNRSLNHLGLDSFFNTLNNSNLGLKVFQGDNVPLRPSLIPILSTLYLDRIESLETYLHEDFSSWKRPFK